MEALADLFETNRIIVLTIYGQVFFVLGLAVALQSLKRSVLALARPLPWLAAFGIVHGFHEWGYLFVPIQSGYLSLPLIETLLLAQLVMKGVSFAFLLQFGIELLLALRAADAHGVLTEDRPPRRGLGPLHWLPAGGLVVWAALTVGISAMIGEYRPDPRPWLPEANIDAGLAAIGAPLAVGDVLARWLLAAPGAALAAIGLARSASALGPLARPNVVVGLRLAALAFVLYGVTGGLIGMAAPFPPANVVNTGAVLDATGVPLEVLRSFTGLLIAVGMLIALQLFEHETDAALASARRRELLARERERIGRDLHDGIIQSIYAAGLHLEEASADIGAEQPAPRARIATVLDELNRITGEIRRTIFDLRAASIETRDPEEIVRSVADELRANTLVAVDLRVEGERPAALDAEQAEQLQQIVHEAFSNVLRHAQAHNVTVRLSSSRRRLRLEIRDDGRGFEVAAVEGRQRTGRAEGLANLRRRAELLGASLDIQSRPGQGTALSLTMPVTAGGRQHRPIASPE